MGTNINHDQVKAALIEGLPVTIIASRMACSERHIRRIRKDNQLEWVQPLSNFAWGSHDEHMRWAWWRSKGASYRFIANRFCLSHEHVRNTLQHQSKLTAQNS